VFHDEGKEGESARSWLGKGMSNYLERGGGGRKRERKKRALSFNFVWCRK
jgi:hypothetical protein